MTTLSIKELANRATHALLAQELLEVQHEPNWEREGFPLPVKRMPLATDGSLTQMYRPMVILEYVQEYLSGEIKARQMRDKAILKKQSKGDVNE
jgi:hypothetical protein